MLDCGKFLASCTKGIRKHLCTVPTSNESQVTASGISAPETGAAQLNESGNREPGAAKPTEQQQVFETLYANQTLPPEAWEAFGEAMQVLLETHNAAIVVAAQ
jgi:hypothetical protein